jgi:hypothetical protein
MPRLWFVYPLNGSGRRNPDAADRGQEGISLFWHLEKEALSMTNREQVFCSARGTLKFASNGPVQGPFRFVIVPRKR